MLTQDPNRQYLYLECPKYLAQWFGHRQYQSQHAHEEYADDYIYNTDRRAYDLDVVQLNRLHPESVLLEMLLVKQSSTPDLPSENVTLCVLIPEYKEKSPRFYNRLSESSKRKFIDKIKKQFDAEIIPYVHQYRAKMLSANPPVRVPEKEAIDAFMDVNGIDPMHIDSVIKAYNRAKDRYRKTMYYLSKVNQKKRK